MADRIKGELELELEQPNRTYPLVDDTTHWSFHTASRSYNNWN